MLPVEPVTTTVVAPAGVWGGGAGVELPPHPIAVSSTTNRTMPSKAAADDRSLLTRLSLRSLPASIKPTIPIDPPRVHQANNGCGLFPGNDGVCREALGPVVFTTRVTVAGLPLGVTDVGVNVQVESAGKPEQLNDTALLKPPAGVIVKVKVADWPALMLALDGLAAMAKSGGAGVTVRVTVAVALSTFPSLTLKVKLSAPLKPLAGV